MKRRIDTFLQTSLRHRTGVGVLIAAGLSAITVGGCQKEGAGSTALSTVAVNSAGGNPAACSNFNPAGNMYVRVVRHRTLVPNDSPMFAWIDRRQPAKDGIPGLVYLLERLNIFLVQGDAKGTEGCAVDFMLGYSGGTNKFTKFKEGEVRSYGDFRFNGQFEQNQSEFKPLETGIPGSGEPLSEGYYRLGDVDWARPMSTVPSPKYPSGFPTGDFTARFPNPAIEGMGPFGIPIINSIGSRGEFYFHVDANEGRAPGTVGCLAIQPEDADKLLCWMQHFRPRDLVADWGLGTVSKLADPYRLDINIADSPSRYPGYPCDPSSPSRTAFAPTSQWYGLNANPNFERLYTPRTHDDSAGR
ncbi:MAG: hypothetical protein IOD12_05870 [Silvanigrellales bacterium]|jgi:hypothetical protein|nr:hypothetical protein [Silvanigrellales bacterium]